MNVINQKPNTLSKCKKESHYKTIFSFSHIRIFFIILIISIFSLLISLYFEKNEHSFCASIFANIFAGLITGLVLCLISGTKQKNLLEIEAKINWLRKLTSDLNIYFTAYNQLVRICSSKTDTVHILFAFSSEAEVYANDINSTILHNHSNNDLSFNSLQFCKEELEYDAESMKDTFKDLHYYVSTIDIDCPSSKEIIEQFHLVHFTLKKLNSKAYNYINKLESTYHILQKNII